MEVLKVFNCQEEAMSMQTSDRFPYYLTGQVQEVANCLLDLDQLYYYLHSIDSE